MADPLYPQQQRNYLDDILDQAFDDLELERQRQESIINAPDPAKRLGEVQKIEKRVENEVPEVQDAVRQKAYTDTSYFTGRPFASQQPQKQGKKRQPISEAMYNRLAQGSAELGQGLASAPGFIYGLASFPQRQLAKIPGLESLDDGTREMEEYLSLNPIAKYYKDTADQFREQNTRYDEGIVDYIKQGNLFDAIGLTAVEIVGSIPYTASMIAGGYAGVPAKLTVPAVATVTGGQKNSTLLEEMPELADDTRTLNALVDGLAEGTFEQMGSAGIGRTIKSLSGDLIKQYGRKDGNKILTESIAKVFSDKSSRFMVPKAMNQEGWEEFATTVVQNLNAQLTGEDPGRDLFEGAIDSYIVGAGASGAITAPTGIAVRKQRKEAKKLEKAKAKGLEAIETGQLRQLTDQDISDFGRSLTKEEAMEIGIAQETGEIDPGSELGKEMIRRNLDMEKFPETEAEFREAGARANIKEQQMEGKDFTGALIKKVREEAPNIVVEEEYLDKTLADEAEQKGWTEEETKQVLRDHGIDEDSDPKEVTVTGTSFGGSIRISRAGTPQRMAEEYVAVQEEMAEEYYKAEQENNPEFENEVAEDRRKYNEATGEQDTGESNLEWFSSKAVHFATQGKVHQSIGAKLTEIFNRFIDNAKLILQNAIRLRKAIKEGKVSDSLLKKLEEATDFKKVGEKVQQAKLSKTKTSPDGSISYRVTEVGNVEPTGVFLIGADMVARDLDGKLNPFGLRYTENYNGFALSKAGATKLVNRGKEGFNTVAVIAYDQIKGSQEANPSFQNRVKEELAKSIGKRRVNKLLKDNNNDVKKVAGIVNKEIQEFNQKKPKAKKKPKINLTQIALDNAEPDALQLRRKIVYVGTLKEIRTGKDRFRKHDVYPAEQIFDNLVELKEPIPIDNLIEELPDSDMRKKNWGMMVTQTNFLMTTDESNIAKQLVEMAQTGKDVFTGTPNPDFQFFSRETEDTTPEQAVERAEGERQFKARQFTSQVDEELGLGTATRSSVGFTEEYGDESALVSRFFGKQDQELLNYRGALIGLMFNQIDVTNFIGSEDGPHSLLKITIDQTDLIGLKKIMQKNRIPNKTIRIRGNQQDILLWDMGDLNNNLINAIADEYNAKEYTKQKGEFQFLTNESSRKKAREAFIGIIQDYQSKTNSGLPKAVSKFLPDFYKRKADRDRLLKQLKAKPKPSYRLAPTFYSKAERVVTEQFPPTMKSQSVINWLKKSANNSPEIEWLDLETLLKGKQKVTKEELQEWIQANKIEVEDVMLGESFTVDEEKSLSKDEFIKMFEVPDPADPDLEPMNTLDYDEEISIFIADGIWTNFKYYKAGDKEYVSLVDEIDGLSLYTIEPHEFGSGYNFGNVVQRNITDVAPGVDGVKNIIGNLSTSATKHSMYQLPGEKEDYRELLLTLPKRPLTSEEFLTGHYEEPNILAHVRFNTRRSPTGEKVLFIEELQSDWHTKGREEGYKPKKEIKELPPEYTIETEERFLDDRIAWRARVPKISTRWLGQSLKKDVAIAQAKGSALRSLNRRGVPDAPFKNNGWIELIMKRMLRYASENNFDRIAWTTSNQQIERWNNDLRKNVDQISWQKTGSITSDFRLADSVIVNGLKKNESVFNQTIPLEGETTINGQKVTLEGLLGKQMATQIRNSEDRTGVIEGNNLTIGGQGFKTIYDSAIKKILNKMGKKFGAKVDQVQIMTDIYNPDSKKLEDLYYWNQAVAQPSIPITRKMKESALKGQPTFRASKMTSTDDVLSSPSFKKWFKGSQVKDKDGKPLVVYHGTVGDFDSFNTPSYFSDAKMVSEFIMEGVDSLGMQPIGENIKPVYLSIQNPKIYTTEKEYDDYVMSPSPTFDSNLETLKNQGFDGIIYKPEDIRFSTYYVAFEPTQIKSIFNKGTFNPHDPRISFRMAPTNLVTPLAKIYQEQKGTKKSYTKKDFENDLIRLGYPEETLKTAMDLFGIIRIKQIETDEPTPIEKELKKIQDLAITRSNLKDRIKRAYRLGAVEKEKEITKLQKIVTNYARKNLPTGLFKKSEVTGLLAKVRDAKRARELATALERIDRIVDKVNKRSALAKWNKTVKKKATVKKVGGIGRGKVGADVQDIVNDIRGKKKGEGIMDLSPADVELKIELMGEIMEKSEDGEPTDDQALQLNLLLTYGAMKHKTPEEITRATNQFDELVTAGRMQVIEDQEAYKERMKEVRQEILEIVSGGVGDLSEAGEQRINLKKEGSIADIKEGLSGYDSQNQSIEYIFDKLSRLDKTSKPLESYLNNYFMPMIRQARIAEYNGLVEMQKIIKEKAEEIFGVKDSGLKRELTKRLEKNTIEKIKVYHRDREDGSQTFSELSYNEAYKKWMELKDPTLHPTFEKMGWDINKTKRQIEDQLPKDMIEWAEWQLYEFYPMYYHRVNETFRKRFNVNMPFNPMYSPISRRIGARADEGDDTLNKSKSPMGSMTSAGSLKARITNVNKDLAWIDGDRTLMKHIVEMEHFIHYTQLMRELRSVFMSPSVSLAIEAHHGKEIRRILNKFMDDIARGGVDRAMHLNWMDKWRINVTRATIGLNEVVFIKQLASIPAYLAYTPTIEWFKGLNILEWKRAYKTLSQSEELKMRYDKGFDRDMTSALQNIKPGKMITGTNWLNNIAFALTKAGDATAIFIGGWGNYKYEYKKALKEGKTREEAKKIAMKKFEANTLRAQQASNVEDLAELQRLGSGWKLFTMYMTSPNQYYRMFADGLRNLKAGRGKKSDNIKKIFVSWILLPQLFSWIANGFEWDDEEQGIALLTGPFYGLLFAGQGIEHMIRYWFNKNYSTGIGIPVYDVFGDLGKVGKGFEKMFSEKNFDTETILSIIDDFLTGASKSPLPVVGGLPYKPVKRSIASKIKVIKEGSEKPFREGIGFKFDDNKKKKKKKKKPKVGGPVYAY